jgi:adenosylhomocysteine nucleosidase
MSKIAFVAALEREVRPLVKEWRSSEKEHDGRWFRFFEDGGLVLVCGGIGAEPARKAAEAVISIYQPDIIYSVGFAGALDSNMKVGDIMEPQRIVNAKDGSSASADHGAGVLVSFGSVAGSEQKRKLLGAFGAHAVDMEAAFVARAAELRSVGFRAIKVISDESDFELPAMERFIDSDGQFLEVRFALFAALRPWLWLRLVQLSRNSSRAARALCDRLRQLHNAAGPVPASRAEALPRR